MKNQFNPPWGLSGKHTQTILGDILPSNVNISQNHELIVTLKDGDQLRCLLQLGESPYLFLLAHGLTGSADAHYITRMSNLLAKMGHSICRMNHRNCGQGLGLSKYPYGAGRSDDIASVIKKLRHQHPKYKIVCIGYSMSGNATLLLAAGKFPCQRDNQKELNYWLPDCAIAINPPVNLSKTTDNFQFGLNRIYQWNFIRGFQKLLQTTEGARFIRNNNIRPWMTIREFDNIYTSKRLGFKDAEDYYRQCSSKQYLQQVKIPTAILSSKDDPFVNSTELPGPLKWGSKLKIIVTEKGGHMGYLSRTKTPHGNHRWMDFKIYQIFLDLLPDII